MSIIASTLINDALYYAGVYGQGQTPNAQDAQLALRALNYMLGQWSAEHSMCYQTIETILPVSLNTGAASYPIGTGQVTGFNTPRPQHLENGCYARQQVGVMAIDYPLRLLFSRQDYDRISLKTLNSFPQYVFYDASYPVG